jgi:hemolysin III
MGQAHSCGMTEYEHDHESPREELANAITHGVGAVAAAIGGIALVAMSARYGNGWQLAGAIVFSLALVLLYAASTLYHSSSDHVVRGRYKVFDHCAIFVLIAGTYTPFTLVGLREDGGWWLFAAIWTLAVAGVVFKLFFTGRFKGLSTLIYIAMGWMVVTAVGPFLRNIPHETTAWLLAGGIAYTLGTVFYMSRRIPFAHAIWHGFVLVGSACHFVAVAQQVLPA